MLKCLLFSVLISVTSATALSDVVLTGTAKDCFQAARVTAPNVAVAAFDPGTNPGILNLFRTLDTVSFADDNADAMPLFDSTYTQLMGLIETSTALARGTSNSVGAFSFSVPARDSILVVGHQEVEDEPFYYGYAMVNGQTSAQFALDMSRGACNHLNP